MESNTANIQEGYYTIYGMFCSYFTKKLENYFQVKGIPYKYVELDSPGFAQLPKKVGVTQFPLVECPDGTWLCDTTPIIQAFENGTPETPIRPRDPLVAFCSYFLEDSFDEWLWAPALYYRWAFDMDERRRSDEFTYTIAARGLPLPRFMLRWVIKSRQTGVHLKRNGLVSDRHNRQIEQLYIDLLDLLQPILKKRPFLFGYRPCEADFGLQGPMFPHFSNDPTPQEIMQVRAPNVFSWVARLWATRPEDVNAAPEISTVPDDLKDLMQKMASDYVPYLLANRNAFLEGEDTTSYKVDGLEWTVMTAPYRVYCLAEIQKRFQILSDEHKAQARLFLGDAAADILQAEIICPEEMKSVTAHRPARLHSDETVSRLWSKKSRFEKLLQNSRANRPVNVTPELKAEGTDWLPIYFKHHRARPNG
jgi:glutathione S-transferase